MEFDQETLKQAKKELETICNKYNIILVPVVVHQGNKTFSSIEIMPRQEEPQLEQTVVE